mgnify:CR=1 FL=1
MRLLTKIVFAFVPALLLAGGAAEAATGDWRQSCVGPEVACSSSPAAPAEKTAVKVKAKKPAAATSNNAVSKPKKVKKIAKAPVDDAAPVKVKKAKKIAKVQSEGEPASKPKKKSKVASKTSSGGGAGQSGVASWYGGYFHGRTTANGEKYNQWAMTAAHKTLPFGTKVRVTNVNNGNSVVVRINDRGPFIKGRIIDLSKAAANDIGMSGVAPVKVTILGKG